MKEFIKNFLNTLAFTSGFVALTGVSLIYAASVFYELPISETLIFIVFLLVFSVYNLNRKTDIKEDLVNYPERIYFIKKHERKINFISSVAGAIAITIAFLLKFEVGIFTLIPFIGVILYSFVPIRLKRVLIIKNLWVSLLWSLCITYLPLIYWNRIDLLFSPTSTSIFLFIFIKGIGNTITFDIRDIKGDKLYGIKTIPSILGIEKTKILLSIINLFSFFVLFFATLLEFISKIGYFVCLVTLYTFTYVYLIGKKDMKFISDILADGEFIIIGLLALVGNLMLGRYDS